MKVPDVGGTFGSGSLDRMTKALFLNWVCDLITIAAALVVDKRS